MAGAYGSTGAGQTIIQQSDVEAAIKAVERLKEPEVKVVSFARGNAEQALFAVVPKDRELRSVKPLLDEYLLAPERIKGTATFTSLESFIEHVKRFQDDGSAVFLSGEGAGNPMLTAVYDYHRKDGPRWGDHLAEYFFPVSDEWKAWTEAQREMSQTEFCPAARGPRARRARSGELRGHRQSVCR